MTGGMNTGAAGLRGVRRAGLRWLGLSPLCVRQRRLALSAHAHSTLAKGAHHYRAGLGRKSRHGCEHSGSAAAGATVPVRCLDHRHGGNRSAGAAQAQRVGDHDDAGGGHGGRVDTVAACTF